MSPTPQPATRRDDFETLLEPLLPAAYRYAAHLANHRADAEDLLQEAALLAFRGYGSFRPGTNFKAWFFRILTHRFYERHRTAQRRPAATVDLEEAPELYLYTRSVEMGLFERCEDPATLLLGKLSRRRILAAVAALPDDFRVVASLFFVDELSYEEIGDILGLPPGTVRSRLHRGRKLLQKTLWRLAEEAGIVRDLTAAAAMGRAPATETATS